MFGKPFYILSVHIWCSWCYVLLCVSSTWMQTKASVLTSAPVISHTGFQMVPLKSEI